MRGELYEKPSGDTSYADNVREEAWKKHKAEHPVYYLIGKSLVLAVRYFALSIVLAYIATKITPENLVIMSHQAGKYLHFLGSLIQWDELSKDLN